MFDAAAAQTNSAPRPVSSSASTTAPAGYADFLLETIVCAVQSTVMQIATLAMMLTHARSAGTGAVRAGRHLLHDDSKAILLALRYAAEIGLGAEIVAKLSKLYAQVGEAKARLAPLLEASRDGRVPQSLLQGHCDSWRRIAAEAATTITQVQQATASRLDPAYGADSIVLRHFLEQAAKGMTDAIDAAGVITPPKLQQRRKAPRLVVERTCALLLPAGPARATVVDVSQGGIGIVCDAALSERQKLIVALEDGRQLEAVVARRKGPQYGLQWRFPLSASDPLFKAVRAIDRK